MYHTLIFFRSCQYMRLQGQLKIFLPSIHLDHYESLNSYMEKKKKKKKKKKTNKKTKQKKKQTNHKPFQVIRMNCFALEICETIPSGWFIYMFVCLYFFFSPYCVFLVLVSYKIITYFLLTGILYPVVFISVTKNICILQARQAKQRYLPKLSNKQTNIPFSNRCYVWQ